MDKKEITFPVAEYFDSIQGEGHQTGMRMFFIRLAGCTVGKKYPAARYAEAYPKDSDKFPLLPILPSYVNECTTFDGRTFPCDTNYQKTETLSIDQLLALIPEGIKWISITGGEPLMHKELPALCAALRREGLYYHIETSGTIIPDFSITDTGYCYLACSPKEYYLGKVIAMADEVRLMVDKDFNTTAALEIVKGFTGQIFLSPLSLQDDITKVDSSSLAKCLDLINMPEFAAARISLQIHKYMAVR